MKIRVYLCTALIFLSAGLVMGQQNVTSATLTGSIQDADGAVVSAASVSAKNLETNHQTTTTSDSEGRYRFPYLRTGVYDLTIEATGFANFTRQLTLLVGQALDLPVRLEVAGLTENVTVGGSDMLVETVRTQLTETIRPRDINELPLNTRNYLDLALLVPGVSPTNTGSNQRFAETSGVPGQGISIAGQRNLYNSFIVDGVSANDDAADLTGTYYSEEVIDQFQVITSGGGAEFGRASGGVVNILTRAGTNDWRSSMYGFLRNQRFDARNPLAPTKDLLTQGQYGATFGGPIQRDRTFLFTNFEQTRRNYSAVLTIDPGAVSTINNRLRAVNYPGELIGTGVVPASFDTTNFFARVDHQINKSNDLSARYSLYHIDAVNSRTVGGLNAISRGTGLSNTDQTLQISNVTMLGSRALNEARFQYTNSRLDAPVNDTIGPAVNIGGVANFGTATFSPLGRDINLFEAVDNVSFYRGDHTVKAGGGVLYNRVNMLFPGAFQGVYNFRSLNNFLAGNYDTFQQAFGVPEQFQSNPNFGLFVQEGWRVNPRLTINAGLRYDAQFLPDPIKPDTNNFSPRLGIAYAPGDGKTAIRASFGLYYDRIPLRATSNALQRDGSKYIVAQLLPTQPGAPTFPNVLTVQPGSLITKPNITRIDPNIESSYSQQANFQVERELPGNTFVSVGYLFLQARHLILSRNVNVPTLSVSAGDPNLGRPDPNWGNISRFESSGNSSYNGMVVSVNQRAASWASMRVSYTFSKTIDDSGNFFFSTPQNNFNLRDERGRSDNDQRHRLVISGSLAVPDHKKPSSLQRIFCGFQMGYIFTYASRLPFNVLLGQDRNLDTNNNDRPVGVGRNTGRGFDFASLDLRLSRRFKLTERLDLQLLAEGFNVLNRSNLGVPNNVFGSGVTPLPNFRRATQAFDPRQFQFGMRVSF